MCIEPDSWRSIWVPSARLLGTNAVDLIILYFSRIGTARDFLPCRSNECLLGPRVNLKPTERVENVNRPGPLQVNTSARYVGL